MSPVFVCGSSHGHRGPRWLASARSGSRDRLSEVPTTITSRSREAALSLVSMRKRSSCPVDQLLCPDKGIADWTCPLRVYGSEQSWHATEPPLSIRGNSRGLWPPPGGICPVQSALGGHGQLDANLWGGSWFPGLVWDTRRRWRSSGTPVGGAHPVAGRTTLLGGIEDCPDDLATVGCG